MSIMSVKPDLLEAVNRLNKIEADFYSTRIEVAKLLKEAAKNEQVTILSQLTGINRTTIYWLINTWSSANDHNDNRNNHSKAS